MSFKINNEPIKVTIFPDKTSQVWKLQEHLFDRMNINIEWEFEHEGEIMHLAQIADLFKSNGTPKINLNISYLPYARQDKDISNDTTFALYSFAKIINGMGFYKVNINDVHSTVALKHINNSFNSCPNFEKIIKTTRADIICFPDHGAYNRYPSMDIDTITLNKVRDQSTGNITKLEIHDKNRVRIDGKRFLIIDDICDGGMTFKLASEVLNTHGALRVDLFVTHGIFSKGLRTLRDSGIARIFTSKGEANEVNGNICYKEIE